MAGLHPQYRGDHEWVEGGDQPERPGWGPGAPHLEGEGRGGIVCVHYYVGVSADVGPQGLEGHYEADCLELLDVREHVHEGLVVGLSKAALLRLGSPPLPGQTGVVLDDPHTGGGAA